MMKKITTLLSIFISIVFFSCERDYNNPYDRECPPGIWTPQEFRADTSGNNITLTWKQSVDHFDGFQIERCSDSINWKILSSKMIDKDNRTFSDSTVHIGDTLFYRIYAIADKNQSNYKYSDKIIIPIKLPTIVTNEVTNTDITSATLNGVVIYDGGAPITERGFCFATTQMPDITKNKIASGSGIGIYTKAITGLQPGTTYYVRAYATNSKGTAYGEQRLVITTATLATVLTIDATNITATSVTLNGEVTSDGGTTVTERGFCYVITAMPDITKTKVTSGAGTGTFTKAITGLQSGTAYYVRAYAINSKGIVYGEQKMITTITNLATVVTNTITDITTTTATLNGEVTSDGGATVTERGFCYATTTMPDINKIKLTSGAGVGTFTKAITGLQLGTTYYVRAYATNGKGTAYGEQKTFTTTATLATVITNDVTAVTSTTATFNGEVTSDGGATVTERGFCYATTAMPDITKTKAISGAGTGNFTKAITGLKPGTTYYVRAYATNSKGTAYGEQMSFTTVVVLPSVLTNAATNIDDTYATLNGEVTSDGGSSVTERGFCYATTSNPDVNDTKITVDSGIGIFSNMITGLTTGESYYVRAYAINAKGIVYGGQITFVANCDCETKFLTFTDSRDGHVYKSIKIGTQTWMAENLAYLPSVNYIFQFSENSPRYYVLNYDGSIVTKAKSTTSYKTFGALYNWPAAKEACPNGWHLPGDDEWTTLFEFLIANGYSYDGIITGNNVAKALATTTGWLSSDWEGSVGNDPSSNNRSCFSAPPGTAFSVFGDSYGRFGVVGYNCSLWTSSQNNGPYACCYYMNCTSSVIEKIEDNSKNHGYSVRCIKD